MKPSAISVFASIAGLYGLSALLCWTYISTSNELIQNGGAILADFFSIIYKCLILISIVYLAISIVMRIKQVQKLRLKVQVLSAGLGFTLLVVTLMNMMYLALLYHLEKWGSTNFTLNVVIALLIIFIPLYFYCRSIYTIYKARIEYTRYMDIEFIEHDKYIIKQWPPKTILDSKKTSASKLGEWLKDKGILIAASVVSAGYPLLNLMHQVGGEPLVVTVFGLILTPFLFYAIGRLTVGYYINIYLAGKLEKETGKPVMYSV